MKILKNNKMDSYELEKKKASYRTIINMYIDDLVLCNNILDVDESVLYNANIDLYDDENDNYIDIYQYFLCNISDYKKEQLTKAGIILSYSDLLDCDVLLVDHFGTSWDYVLTDVAIVDNYEDL